MAADLTSASTVSLQTAGVMRQIAKGRSAGSRRMRCSLPCQVDRRVAHQIVNDDRGVVGQLPFPQRHFDRRFLDVKRIEIDGDQDHVAAAGSGLP